VPGKKAVYGLQRPQFYLFPFGTWIQSFTPRWLAIRIGWRLVDLAFPFLKKTRRAIARNFRYILGRELESGEGDRIARRVLRNMAVTGADLMRVPRLCRTGMIEALVPVQHERSRLDAVLSTGKGVVFVTAHVGNWDLGGIFLSYLGYPIAAVFERLGRGMSEVFNRYRSVSGVELVAMDDRESMNRALEAGKVFCLVCDRDMKGTGQELPWFSGRRTFPRGAASFSLRHDVPMITAYCVLEPGDPRHRYRLVVGPPIDFEPGGDFTSDVENLTALLVKRLERMVSLYPEQWFVFDSGWRGSGHSEPKS